MGTAKDLSNTFKKINQNTSNIMDLNCRSMKDVCGEIPSYSIQSTNAIRDIWNTSNFTQEDYLESFINTYKDSVRHKNSSHQKHHTMAILALVFVSLLTACGNLIKTKIHH